MKKLIVLILMMFVSRSVFSQSTNESSRKARMQEIKNKSEIREKGLRIREAQNLKDAALVYKIEFDDNAAYLQLEYRFNEPGDGDYMQISVNGKSLYKLIGRENYHSDFELTKPIDISMYAGEFATYTIKLISVGKPKNAHLRVKDLSIIKFQGKESVGIISESHKFKGQKKVNFLLKNAEKLSQEAERYDKAWSAQDLVGYVGVISENPGDRALSEEIFQRIREKYCEKNNCGFY